MAHVINHAAIGAGATLWLQAYDEDEYAMRLHHVMVDQVAKEGALFHSLEGQATFCGWTEDYNYRFGWRCWDEKPSEEELACERFAS